MANKIDIPNGWEVKKLGEVFKKINIKNKDKLITQVLTNSAQYGVIAQEEFFDKSIATKENINNYYTLNIDDFIYNPRISKFAPAGPISRNKYKIGCVSPLYTVFKMTANYNIDFYELYFKSNIWNRQAYNIANFGARFDRMNITDSDFFNMPIPVPPLAEQEKIAEILSLWDKAIEHTKELIAYKEKQKKGLMQNLLTGKKRLHGWTDDWKNIELGEVLTERNIYAEKNGKYHHVSLTKYGIIQKNDKYDRDYLVTKQGKEYKITRKDDICYNPANLKFGVICKNNYGVGIFSPIYITFEVNSDYNTDFIAFVLTQQSFIDKIRRYEEGTVYERKAVKPKDFLLGRILIPTLFNEQKAIADILLKADKEIELLNKQLELYTEQKKGLMQNLLTGRVKV